jgi:hypothetical protein
LGRAPFDLLTISLCGSQWYRITLLTYKQTWDETVEAPDEAAAIDKAAAEY